jgi:glycosyltransferase involved in cell wall biosynthesis
VEAPSIVVSIIIPMRNEERFIGRCLDSILANDFHSDQYEILVVDGRSTDCSSSIVTEKATRFPQIRLLDNPARIIPAAINLGIREAKGKYVIRMDAHSEYPANYIRTCIQELERTGADNVGGRWITKPGANSLIARAIAMMTQHPVGVGNAAYRIGLGDRFVDTVPFGAYRRELFDRIGLYREDLARHEDYEFNARIRKAGGKIYLSSKIDITYYNVPTLSKFMWQAYGNGVYMTQAWLRTPASFCWRHAAPLGFLSLVLGGLALGPFWGFFRTGAIIAVAVYTFFLLAASIQISLRHGIAFLFILPGLFFCYHFVYGVSTLYGLVRYPFARRACTTSANAPDRALSFSASSPQTTGRDSLDIHSPTLPTKRDLLG